MSTRRTAFTMIVAICIVFLACSEAARADVLVDFTSRALFGGNDSAVWGPPGGPDNTLLGSTFSITSTGGLGITATVPPAENMALTTQNISGGPTQWHGNFAPGDRV